MPMKQFYRLCLLSFLGLVLIGFAGCTQPSKSVNTIKERPQPDFSKAPDPLESTEALDQLMPENQSKQNVLEDVTPVEPGYATK